MVVVAKEMKMAHGVKNLPDYYSVEQFVKDDDLNKWVVTVAHPTYGSIECYEDSVVVEEQTGRNTILIAYTMERFKEAFDVLLPDEQEAEFELNRSHAME